MSAPLEKLLATIEWKANITAFGAQADVPTRIETQLTRLAVWSGQLANAEPLNPAIAFVREMQVQGHYVAALLGLGLYKPAASAMRAVAECALYYTYFRVHPMELATSVRDPGFYVEKRDILDFHLQHGPDFKIKEAQFGAVSSLKAWYSETSGIIHGQHPGKWVTHQHLSTLTCNPDVLGKAAQLFERGIDIVNHLFLCTIPPEVWASFAANARRNLLKGLSAPQKTVLGLSVA